MPLSPWLTLRQAREALRTGRPEEARRAMRHLRRLDPALRIAKVGEWVLLRRPADLATFADGLRKVGLPA